MRFIDGDICIISPLIRHSFLLSSSTVFMDSIHSVSTGPSNTTHLRSSFCAEANSLCRREEKKVKVNTCTLRHLSLSLPYLKVLATTPSVHSCDIGSNCPNSCPIVMLLGLITRYIVLYSSIWSLSFNKVSVSASTSITLVFAANGAPTYSTAIMCHCKLFLHTVHVCTCNCCIFKCTDVYVQ